MPARKRRTTHRTRTTRATEPAEIFVKLARTGGAVHEVCLNGARTIQDLFNAAESEFGFEYKSGERIRVNGKEATLSTELSDGQRVTVSGKIQGGIK